MSRLDSREGKLRWTDFPEPVQQENPVLRRKKVELWGEKGLPKTLAEARHT